MNKITALGLTSIAALVVVAYIANPAASVETDNTKIENRGDLAFVSIPPHDFIHLFDSTPDTIAGGHFAMKVNCDQNGNGAVVALLGVAPEMNQIKLTADTNMVKPLSTPGQMCLYHIDLPPEDGMQITDIALMNPSDNRLRLGATASYTLYVNSWGEQVEEMD